VGIAPACLVAAPPGYEDHVLKGGFESAVFEELNNLGLDTPVVRVGWPDRFIEHGKPETLRAKYGISVEAALEKLLARLKAPARPPAMQAGQPSLLGVLQPRLQRLSRRPDSYGI